MTLLFCYKLQDKKVQRVCVFLHTFTTDTKYFFFWHKNNNIKP